MVGRRLKSAADSPSATTPNASRVRSSISSTRSRSPCSTRKSSSGVSVSAPAPRARRPSASARSRSSPGGDGCGSVAASIRPATASMVEASKSRCSGMSTPKSSTMRLSICSASRECPPRSKKSSWTPIGSTPSSSAQIRASRRSSGVRGSTRSCPGGAAGGVGLGKRTPIDLSVRRERHLVERDEERGHHVVGQRSAQVLPQLAGAVGIALVTGRRQ